MLRLRLFIATMIVLGVLASAYGQEQEYSKVNFNIGSGFSVPQGDLGSFVNDGANIVVGGGLNFSRFSA